MFISPTKYYASYCCMVFVFYPSCKSVPDIFMIRERNINRILSRKDTESQYIFPHKIHI